jgi:hypothetical protein
MALALSYAAPGLYGAGGHVDFGISTANQVVIQNV